MRRIGGDSVDAWPGFEPKEKAGVLNGGMEVEDGAQDCEQAEINQRSTIGKLPAWL